MSGFLDRKRPFKRREDSRVGTDKNALYFLCWSVWRGRWVQSKGMPRYHDKTVIIMKNERSDDITGATFPGKNFSC